MRRIIIMLGLLLPALTMAKPLEEWVVTHDAGGYYVDTATEALVDAAGNLIVGGATHDGVDGTDISVAKYDRSDGSLIWDAYLSAYDHVSDMAIDGMVWDGFGDILVAGRLLGCGTG